MFNNIPKTSLLPVKEKEKKLPYYINLLYKLYNFINCQVFVNIKQILHYKVAVG